MMTGHCNTWQFAEQVVSIHLILIKNLPYNLLIAEYHANPILGPKSMETPIPSMAYQNTSRLNHCARWKGTFVITRQMVESINGIVDIAV